MRGLPLALVFALAGLPAARAEDAVDVPGLDAPELAGDALLWEDAVFYLEPWEGGANVRFSHLTRSPSSDVGRTIPVRIVASTRTFVEVVPSAAVGCAARRLEIDPRVEALRLFVKRSDLAPVLTRPYSASFSDGTSVRIAAGMPVLPARSGRYVVAPRGDKLGLPIPHGSVGYVFSAARVAEPERLTGAVVRVDRSTAVKLGGEPFEVRGAWLAPKPTRRADTQLLRWSARCIDLTVAVAANVPRPATVAPPYRSYDPVMPTLKLPQQLLAGTPLKTPGGREVAVAADAIEVEAPTDAGACFDARLAIGRIEDPPQGAVSRTVKLCGDAAHMIGAVGRAAPKTVSVRPDAAPLDVAAPPASAKRTAKGVWYRVLSPGTSGGRSPKPTDSVKVHYSGWTTDGKLFDSSLTRGVPAVFPLSAVIAGWTDGLQVMTVGMKARLWIPEELAYKGSPGRPAGMLVFDVELLEIQ
jgi:hypothetical protein